MKKRKNLTAIIAIVFSFLLITIALFCLITTMILQFGLDDLFVPTTSEPTEEITPENTLPSGTPINPIPQTPVTTPVTDTATPWILSETLDAGLEYQNKITFLGDSTTHGMKSYGVLSDGKDTEQVWYGEVGNTITFAYVNTVKIKRFSNDTPMLIPDAAEKYKPKILYITLGVTGGVSTNLAEEGFKEIYKILIGNILEKSPETKIVLQSIYPVTKNIDPTYGAIITNEKIMKANTWIEDICEELYKSGKSVYYLDTYSVLVNDEGYLPENYSNGDGLHLSAAGFSAVLSNIRKHKLP